MELNRTLLPIAIQMVTDMLTPVVTEHLIKTVPDALSPRLYTSKCGRATNDEFFRLCGCTYTPVHGGLNDSMRCRELCFLYTGLYHIFIDSIPKNIERCLSSRDLGFHRTCN